MAALREKRGLALVMLERPQDARAELEEAHRLDPTSASACLNLAVLHAQEGRVEAALTYAREALRLQPDYPQARGLLAALQGGR
jgi:tetratricopeptide (TPR) repeat protein